MRKDSRGNERRDEDTIYEKPFPQRHKDADRLGRIDWDVGKAKRNILLEIREAFPLMLVPGMNQNTLGFCGCLPAHFHQTPCMTIFFVKGKQHEGMVLTELQDFGFFWTGVNSQKELPKATCLSRLEVESTNRRR